MVDVFKANITIDEVPGQFDAFFFDGFLLFHTMKNIPKTFSNISTKTKAILTATRGT